MQTPALQIFNHSLPLELNPFRKSYLDTKNSAIF